MASLPSPVPRTFQRHAHGDAFGNAFGGRGPPGTSAPTTRIQPAPLVGATSPARRA